MVAAGVTITLPVPTPYAVDPARLVAWLLSRKWDPGPDGYVPGKFTMWMHPSGSPHIHTPSDDDCDLPGQLAHVIKGFAQAEDIEPPSLAALLAPPVEGPALQWAHMAAAAREAVLALLDGPAAEHRAAATLARMADDAESALAHEGDALGLEAAAAVLRSPPAPAPDLSALRGELLRAGQVEALDALDRLRAAGRRGSEG